MASKMCPPECPPFIPLVIERLFDAPRARVWRAWTEPDDVRRWWGPKEFTCPHCDIDLRVGGIYLFCMRSPAGDNYWSTGVYRVIDPPHRLACTDAFADASGKVVPATHYGMSAAFPLEMMITVTLVDEEGRTRMTLRHDGLPPGADFDDCRTGWNQSFDKLETLLAQA